MKTLKIPAYLISQSPLQNFHRFLKRNGLVRDFLANADYKNFTEFAKDSRTLNRPAEKHLLSSFSWSYSPDFWISTNKAYETFLEQAIKKHNLSKDYFKLSMNELNLNLNLTKKETN